MIRLASIPDVLRMALHSLAVHKARSVLTSLGIIFGVFSVIAMLAINEGAAFEAQRALRELGSDNIILRSVKPEESSRATDSRRGALHYGLTDEDVQRLADNIPGVIRCVTVHQSKRVGRIGAEKLTVVVLATEPQYVDVARTELVAGRFINHQDMLQAKAHCVITKSLAEKLFRFKDPLMGLIRLGGEPFRVVGVLEKLPRSMAEGAGPGGNYAIIPMTSDRQRFGEYNINAGQGTYEVERVQVSQVILQMDSDQAVVDGAEISKSLMRRYHEGDDYEITVPLELIRQKARQRRLWNIMFLAIASVSLIVGGIGIMSNMLASVTERTREIGVRRAMGAKRSDIVAQFLIEAVTLTTAGGILGILLGLAIPQVIEKTLQIPAIISPWTLVLPFAMAVIVGLASGLYPAWQASRLDPIEALRHE